MSLPNATHRKPNRPALAAALLATLAGLAPAAWGFDLTSGAPITISADTARLDDGKGVATYTGSVVVTQERTRLSAARVVLYREQGELTRIEADGQPARYQQPARDGNGETDARALRITYSAKDNVLTFEREAVIEQDGNLFRGDIIHYDTAQRVVTAEGAPRNGEGPGRVEMVIQPRSSDGQKEGQ